MSSHVDTVLPSTPMIHLLIRAVHLLRIPFMETRKYVQRVMENMQVYHTRFGTDAPLTIDTDLRRDTAVR